MTISTRYNISKELSTRKRKGQWESNECWTYHVQHPGINVATMGISWYASFRSIPLRAASKLGLEMALGLRGSGLAHGKEGRRKEINGIEE